MASVEDIYVQGECTFNFKDDNNHNVSYTFKDMDEMYNIGLALMKGVLLSRVTELELHEHAKLEDKSQIIEEFTRKITDELCNDSSLQEELEEHRFLMLDTIASIGYESVVDDESESQIER